MAKIGQERSTKATLKRMEFDEKELRHGRRLGTRQKLEVLMAWNEDTEQASVIEGCLRYVDPPGPESALEALKSRHEIEISEHVALEFRNQSLAEAKRDAGDEIVIPYNSLALNQESFFHQGNVYQIHPELLYFFRMKL
ncbi:hypothetical protein [Pseudomonas sp. NMS19W]|uniref:hypothetical protein n=1 Tax=Pseudomonas sp. NMS19W TaxID=3079768 RepID=UPI003F655E53